MEAQLQIRQNALEAQDYMRDLLDWQKTMNSKVKSGSKQSADCLDVPAVRARAGDSAVSAPVEAMQQPALLSRDSEAAQSLSNGASAAHPASHTYKNYSKWDKFDVDAALKEQDLKPDISRSENAQEAKSQAVQPAQQQPAATAAAATASVVRNQAAAAGTVAPSERAAAFKDQGNKLFQAGYYNEAIDCYNQSIDMQPTSVAFANRAMALLKQKKYQQVEQDCTAALMLDAGYVKAHHRRGTARLHMGQLLAAAVDFEAALRLEPHNKAIQTDRDNALAKHCQAEKINSHGSSWHSIPVAIHQPLQQQQQQRQQQQHLTAGVGLPMSPAPSSAIGQSKAPGSLAGAAQLAAARLASSIRPPKTSGDFEAAWRSFRGDAQLQAKYLKLIEPQQLPAILKNSLTASLLTSILGAALAAAAGRLNKLIASVDATGCETAGSSNETLDVPHAVLLLDQLVRVPRFAMTVMCLTAKDKVALKELWDAAAAAADARLQEHLASLRVSYKL